MRIIFNEKCALHIEREKNLAVLFMQNIFFFFFWWIKFMRSMLLSSHAMKLCLETVLSYEERLCFLSSSFTFSIQQFTINEH